MTFRSVLRAGVPVLALTMGLVACGSDDDDAGTTTTAEEATADTEEVCALAQEIASGEGIPTAEQVTSYMELAPDEISEAVDTAGQALLDAGDDQAAAFLVFADDEVQAATDEINAWEIEHCDIEHEINPPEQGEIDPDATRVDVVATEYSFDFPTELSAGPTSLVMTNAGAEVHFMAIAQLAEGHTMEEALAFEGDPEEAGLLTGVSFDSNLAAPGGADEEVVTADLEPGNWAMLCFIPGPDGTPHAFSGMAVPFTVS